MSARSRKTRCAHWVGEGVLEPIGEAPRRVAVRRRVAAPDPGRDPAGARLRAQSARRRARARPARRDRGAARPPAPALGRGPAMTPPCRPMPRHAGSIGGGAPQRVVDVRRSGNAPRSFAAVLTAALLLIACAGPGGGASGSAASAARAEAAPAPLSPERIAEIVASPDRSAADRTNDLRRKPAEMLAFIGVRPGSIALDLSAGGGYTTELLARAVGPAGRVYGQSAPRDPAGPRRLRPRAPMRRRPQAVPRRPPLPRRQPHPHRHRAPRRRHSPSAPASRRPRTSPRSSSASKTRFRRRSPPPRSTSSR